MQYEPTIPLSFILSPKGRGSKPSPENESPFGERDSQSGNDQIPSPLGGEGRVRGVFNYIDTCQRGTPATDIPLVDRIPLFALRRFARIGALVEAFRFL